MAQNLFFPLLNKFIPFQNQEINTCILILSKYRPLSDSVNYSQNVQSRKIPDRILHLDLFYLEQVSQFEFHGMNIFEEDQSVISRKSFSVGLFEVSPQLDSGFALLAEMPREGHCVLPSTSYWSHMMSVCSTAGDVNFDHLVNNGFFFLAMQTLLKIFM